MQTSRYGTSSGRPQGQRRFAAVCVLAGALLFAGSVNADLYRVSESFSESDMLVSDRQCLQEGRFASVAQFLNNSGSNVVTFIRTSLQKGSRPQEARSSSVAQPEPIAFAAVFLLTLSLIARRRKVRV
ncbi:MAG: hypothetical protein R3208_06675 [Ketobacteraceae bacterium]|nr:hypothetical protein [Ketobacteraceae bacterium]